jgi:hypothetical protein
MGEDRSRILALLADGKITADEAERLLDALDSRPEAAGSQQDGPRSGGPQPDGAPADGPSLGGGTPKYLYVKVVSEKGDNVNVRIPLSLVRSGLKLTSLIPPQAMDQINDSMREHGMSLDFSNLKPEDIEELIGSLREMEINVDSKSGDNIRVYAA